MATTDKPKECQLGDCDGTARIAKANGLYVCGRHYQRWRKHRSFDQQERRKSNVARALGAMGEPKSGPRLTGPVAHNYSPNSANTDISIAEGPKLDDPLSDEALLERYGPLIEEFAGALLLDSNYCTEIIARARAIEKRRKRKDDS